MTRLHLFFGTVALLCAVVIPSASAAVITIDGQMTDWGAGDEFFYWHDGDEGMHNSFDINYNCWTIGNRPTDQPGSDPTCLFLAMTFISDFPVSGIGSKSSADFSYFMLDVDPAIGNSAPQNGGYWPETDQFSKWLMDSGSGVVDKDLTLYKWSGTQWLWKYGGARESGDSGIWAAWAHNVSNNTWALEYQIPLTCIWTPTGEVTDFGWASTYDNGSVGPGSEDDICPGLDDWNRHEIPEPGTFGLFGLGLLGLVAFRRRRNAQK